MTGALLAREDPSATPPDNDLALRPSGAPVTARPKTPGPAVTPDGRVRLLLAEDDRLTREALARSLEQWGYAVTSVSEGGTAIAALLEPNAPRLALLDWEMPGLSGVDVCRLLRGRQGAPYVYIVLGTGRRGQRQVIDGLAAGADDYVKKPFDLSELEVRLRAGRRVVLLQDQLVAAQRALEERALYDGLTGAKNRGAIAETLVRELARTRRTGRGMCIFLADVDHFKQVNDTHGHPAGDAVLREFVRRLGREVRTHDEVGRWGGEEFLVIAPECPGIQAFGVAERLRAAIAREPFETPGGLIRVTASFGAAGTDQGYSELNGLVSAADSALYRAKGAGRNRTVLADPAGTSG